MSNNCFINIKYNNVEETSDYILGKYHHTRSCLGRTNKQKNIAEKALKAHLHRT